MKFSKPTYLILASIALFALFSALMWWMNPYNFCYQEDLSTMIYDRYRLVNMVNRPGGICRIIAATFMQMYVNPASGVLFTAGFMTVLTLLFARFLKVLYGSWAIASWAMVLSLIQMLLRYNINYLNTGTIALIITLITLNVLLYSDGTPHIQSQGPRIVTIYALNIFLYAICGAVSMLFAVVLVLVVLFKVPKMFWKYLPLPFIVLVLGWISVHTAQVPNLEQALLPNAYFNARLAAPKILIYPWIIVIVFSVTACVLRYVRGRKLSRALAIVGCVVAVGEIFFVKHQLNPDTELFKELNFYIHNDRWDDVIDRCKTERMDNLLMQNCLNLALAEKGMLGDSIFTRPAYDLRSIYNTGDSRPYIAALLSDVYYSMGHIALSQRYAFEALEALDNNSPYLLKRLAETNIIFGNYKVADKYLKTLERTLFYGDWARAKRKLLSDEAVMADPEMSLKRKCIFPDNRFSGIYGLDDDLKQVIRNNPEHQATRQYLPALYLLTKDLPRFKESIDEFYIPETPVPDSYRQGIIAYFGENAGDSIYSRYGITVDDLNAYRTYKSRPIAERNSLYYFLQYVY